MSTFVRGLACGLVAVACAACTGSEPPFGLDGSTEQQVNT